jgi:hypothetical protein
MKYEHFRYLDERKFSLECWKAVFLILRSRSKAPMVPTILIRYFVSYFALENKTPGWYFVK